MEQIDLKVTTLIQSVYYGWERADWEEGRCSFCGIYMDLTPITQEYYELIAKQDTKMTIIRHCGLLSCKPIFGPEVMGLEMWVSKLKNMTQN